MAGGVREFDVCSCRVRTCFVYVIKPPYYSVQIYECIPGIYVITLFEFKMFIVYFCRVGVCRDQLGGIRVICSGYCGEKWVCPEGHIVEQ